MEIRRLVTPFTQPNITQSYLGQFAKPHDRVTCAVHKRQKAKEKKAKKQKTKVVKRNQNEKQKKELVKNKK